MIPGTTTKLTEKRIASAATIQVDKDLILLTTTTSIATLVPHFGGGFSGVVVLVPTGGAITVLTTGNIPAGATLADGKATVLVYSKTTDDWYTHALS